MSAVAIAIERLRGLGIELVPLPGGRIRYRAPGPLPPEARALLDDLRDHKPEVLAVLDKKRAAWSPEPLDSRAPQYTRPRKLIAIEYDTRTRLVTRFYSDGTRETPR